MALTTEKDTFSSKDLGAGSLVELASLTATADMIVQSRLRFDTLAGDQEYQVEFRITPDGGSERAIFGSVFTFADTSAGLYVTSTNLFLEEDDVLKVYAKNSSDSGDASVAGEVFWVDVTPGDTDAAKLASDGLDAIAVTEPTGVATTFAGMMVQLWRRFFKKTVATDTGSGTGTIKTYKDDGSTVVTTQAITDDGTDQSQGAAS